MFVCIKLFSNWMKIEFCWRQIFEILIMHKPSHGSCEVPHKIWAWSVQPFRRLLNTNRQTSKVYLYREIEVCSSILGPLRWSWGHRREIVFSEGNVQLWFNTNYSTGGMVINTQDTNYSIGGMVINTLRTLITLSEGW